MTAADEPTYGEFPLRSFLGHAAWATDDGRATATIDIGAEHLNPNGMVHGAVLFALVDTAMGAAAMAVLPEGTYATSVDLQLRFVRPASAGSLTATVRGAQGGPPRASTCRGQVARRRRPPGRHRRGHLHHLLGLTGSPTGCAQAASAQRRRSRRPDARDDRALDGTAHRVGVGQRSSPSAGRGSPRCRAAHGSAPGTPGSAATPPPGRTRSPGSCGSSSPTTARPGPGGPPAPAPGCAAPVSIASTRRPCRSTTTPVSPLATRATGSLRVTRNGRPTSQRRPLRSSGTTSPTPALDQVAPLVQARAAQTGGAQHLELTGRGDRVVDRPHVRPPAPPARPRRPPGRAARSSCTASSGRTQPRSSRSAVQQLEHRVGVAEADRGGQLGDARTRPEAVRDRRAPPPGRPAPTGCHRGPLPTRSASTVPASTLASWSGSPTSTRRASGRSASSRLGHERQVDHGRLVDHDQVVGQRRCGRSWRTPPRRRRPSSRCTVVASAVAQTVEHLRSTTCASRGELGHGADCTASVMRAAALPVGAHSASCRSGSTTSAAASSRATVRVLPVPGPPTITAEATVERPPRRLVLAVHRRVGAEDQLQRVRPASDSGAAGPWPARGASAATCDLVGPQPVQVEPPAVPDQRTQRRHGGRRRARRPPATPRGPRPTPPGRASDSCVGALVGASVDDDPVHVVAARRTTCPERGARAATAAAEQHQVVDRLGRTRRRGGRRAPRGGRACRPGAPRPGRAHPPRRTARAPRTDARHRAEQLSASTSVGASSSRSHRPAPDAPGALDGAAVEQVAQVGAPAPAAPRQLNTPWRCAVGDRGATRRPCRARTGRRRRRGAPSGRSRAAASAGSGAAPPSRAAPAAGSGGRPWPAPAARAGSRRRRGRAPRGVSRLVL